MMYKKPDVTLLGNAEELIQGQPKGGGNFDAPYPNGAPAAAYDLDE